MDKIELRDLLHQEYKSENWKKITEFVFPNVSYLQKPQDIPIKNYDGIVESFKQLGNVKLNDGKNLAIFEVRVSDSINIPYNRVKLRSLVAPFIDQEHNHGVLVIYEQGKENYRFTFTAKSTEFDEEKGDFVNKETDAKRYTYVLGKNESCKTAADRFFDLANKKVHADINSVQDAFSVERLSKQFFKEYKGYYEKFVDYLMASTSYHSAIFKSDDKAIRDFVKLLLGRLVFIQFVQKKRWMGVPPKADGWHNGEPDFLLRSFKNFHNKGLFYSHFLEPLFYETLSKPNRPNDIFSVTGTKVPFLNGGLFEKEETDTALVNFPESYFYDLLEFFDKYNFTINEYDPVDHEVGIDPEMLGSIFENLLEDNKDKGAFYTPKEIVHYMCQESLKEYLKTYLQNKNVWIECNDFEKGLEAFVKKKEAGGVIDFDEILATALRDVKICDPAIGSGAFPMGLLNEIYHCVYMLYSASPDVVGEIWKMDRWSPDVVKKNIIQNSIYGVDIEKGAVDIARLRFWLSLIIDEPEPHALPNLDFKIVIGNSLMSKLGSDIIDIDWNLNETSHGLFGTDLAEQKRELLKKISWEQKEFFNPGCDKKKLEANIRKLKIDLLINQLELMVTTRGLETKPSGTGKILAEQMELYLQTIGWKENIKLLEKQKDSPEQPLHFFDWKLDFPEVLNELINPDRGFDIVIGNPPYIYNRELPELERNIYQNKYSVSDDLYHYFTIEGLNILKSKGVLTFITPNTYFTLSTKQSFRNLLLNYNRLKFTYCGFVFDEAYVEAQIFLLQKTETSNSSKIYLVKDPKRYSNFESLSEPYDTYRSNFLKRFYWPTDLNKYLITKLAASKIGIYQMFSEVLLGKETKNYESLKKYREELKSGEITLLGLICEGEQGLVTGNNSKYVGSIINEKSEAKNIDSKFLNLLNQLSGAKEILLKDFESNKPLYYNEAELLKLKTKKPSLFGKFFNYQTIERHKILNYNDLRNNIAIDGGDDDLWIFYNRGNSEGLRWFVPYKECISWSRSNLNELRIGKKTNSRWQGEKFYGVSGFGWVDYFTDKINAFYVEAGPYSKNIVKFHSSINVSDKYIVALLNSKLLNIYLKNFITATHTLQINDGRLLPIIIPDKKREERIIDLVDKILSMKISDELSDISLFENEIDTIVYDLYDIDYEMRKFIEIN